ncbi:putative purine permease 8 [Cardamine amara subsp. amara]|uniref:Probable purine permease n=1 Tax=Cardamine amara subsp. amara TaxID=228776 RepID=A0ABD0ZN52_CARAN
MDGESSSSSVAISKNRKRWFHIFLYSFFVLSCQATSTILGRLYYQNGGKSKWMGSLLTIIGFPVLVLFRFFSTITQQPQTTTTATTNTNFRNLSSFTTIGSVYIGIGLLVSATCYLSSFGLLYLPVSTFSLICASQLVFTAFFSYILNSQKFTPYIVNSLFLLIISSTLLVFNNESQTAKVSKAKYAIGFLCTVAASATNGLLLSLVQLILRKVLKRNTFSTVTEMVFYQSIVATCALLVGLFASGEWKTLTGEMKSYKLGEVSYVMTLVFTAITWQVYTIGLVGLIFESSSVFCNAITAVGLPIVPILAVVVFHDKMDGIKVISIILAIWGFLSFAYQHYLDDKDLKKNLEGVPNLPLPVSSQDKDDRDNKQQAANSERSIEIDMIPKS